MVLPKVVYKEIQKRIKEILKALRVILVVYSTPSKSLNFKVVQMKMMTFVVCIQVYIIVVLKLLNLLVPAARPYELKDEEVTQLYLKNKPILADGITETIFSKKAEVISYAIGIFNRFGFPFIFIGLSLIFLKILISRQAMNHLRSNRSYSLYKLCGFYIVGILAPANLISSVLMMYLPNSQISTIFAWASSIILSVFLSFRLFGISSSHWGNGRNIFSTVFSTLLSTYLSMYILGVFKAIAVQSVFYFSGFLK